MTAVGGSGELPMVPMCDDTVSITESIPFAFIEHLPLHPQYATENELQLRSCQKRRYKRAQHLNTEASAKWSCNSRDDDIVGGQSGKQVAILIMPRSAVLRPPIW